jgi:hypothetical protein
MAEIPGIGDERTMIEIGPISVPDGEPITLKVPRFDYLPPDKHDALFEDLVALDVDAELVAVSNDLADTPVGTTVYWNPLSKQARGKLIDMGVTVTRIVEAKRREDELSVKSAAVLKKLSEYSDRTLEPLHKRVRKARLTALKHVLTPEQLAVCERLANGQLNEIWAQWEKKSDISLGELLASDSS